MTHDEIQLLIQRVLSKEITFGEGLRIIESSYNVDMGDDHVNNMDVVYNEAIDAGRRMISGDIPSKA